MTQKTTSRRQILKLLLTGGAGLAAGAAGVLPSALPAQAAPVEAPEGIFASGKGELLDRSVFPYPGLPLQPIHLQVGDSLSVHFRPDGADQDHQVALLEIIAIDGQMVAIRPIKTV